MYNDFAAQYAPDVALPPYGELATPEPEAGLAPPENLYDSRGNPLNYIQSQGGPREFLVPRGQAAFAAPPGPTSPQIPVRLRGRTQQTPDYPLGASTDAAPQDLMRPQEQPGTSFGQRAVLPVPHIPTRNGPGAIIPIPPDPTTHGSIRQRQMEDRVAGAAMYDRTQQNIRNPAGSIQDEFNAGTAGGIGTLQRVLEDQGFNISDFLDRLRGHASPSPGPRPRRAPSSNMESELRPIADPHADLSMIDNPPNVTPVSARHGNSPGNYNGRAQEVYDLLTSRGIRLTPGAGVRNRNAVRGGHPDGNSIDIPPQQYEEAIAIIRERYPNMPLQPRFIRRGERFPGGVVATGDHYHVDMGDAALR